MRGASAFAGDFALFFWRHRSEAAAFLALSSSHCSDLPWYSTARVELFEPHRYQRLCPRPRLPAFDKTLTLKVLIGSVRIRTFQALQWFATEGLVKVSIAFADELVRGNDYFVC
jgi:hypothetical protein